MINYTVVSGPSKEDIDDICDCGGSFEKAISRWQHNKRHNAVLNRIVIENGNQCFWIDDVVEVTS